MSKKTAKHHHLLTGEITFQSPGNEGMNSVLMNGVLLTNTKGLLLRDIGRGQQILQINLHNSFADGQKDKGSGIKILNVVVTNISYLGLFTEDEWKEAPQGTKMVEVTPEVDLEQLVEASKQH